MSVNVRRPIVIRLFDRIRSSRFQWAAWLFLLVATGILVRGEVLRPELPPGVRLIPDLPYRDDGGRFSRLDLYAPTGAIPDRGYPVVVAIHGGGWRGGSRGDFGRSIAELAQCGWVVAAIDYELSRPGRPSWPRNRDDVKTAVRWIREHARDYGIDPQRLALLGASAGGHLALTTGLDPTLDIDAIIDFYGPSDLRALTHDSPPAAASVALLLGGDPASIDSTTMAEASPVNLVRPHSPPVLIIHGADDTLVPADQSRRLAAVLEAAGVAHQQILVPAARHGFGLRAGPENRVNLVPELRAFLEAVWSSPPPTQR